jgi:hypothetical protein
MPDEELQSLADATEAAFTERYDRLRHLLATLDDASRRADAMLRLERSLGTQPAASLLPR